MAWIELSNVSVSFPIYDMRSRSLKRRAMSAMTGGRIKAETDGRISNNTRGISVHALDRVSLTVEHGSKLGLIGRNGAGKTTLLQVIAGIFAPQNGKVMIDGKMALFGGSLGIDPELTGRENIELRGLYLGLSKADIRARLNDVIAFTELGEFIDMPFRTYSAGMRARLDFAISTSIDADILLIDEGLGAGDASFLKKTKQRLNQLTQSAGIVVLATHSEDMIRKTCDKAVLLERGRIEAIGETDEVLKRYRALRAA